MKSIPTLTIAGVVALLPLDVPAQAQTESPYLSLKLEMKRAIKRGNEFLKTKQTEAGKLT